MFHNRTLWLLLKSWQAVGANFTSSSLDTRVGSAATESAVHRFVEHRKWITGVHMRSHRSKLQFLVGKRLLSSAEGYKIDGAQHCGKIWGWIFPSDLATAASQPQRRSDLDHTQNKLHSEMMHLPLRLQAILMRKTNLEKSFFFLWCTFTEMNFANFLTTIFVIVLWFFCVFRGAFEQDVENGYDLHPDVCHGETQTFYLFSKGISFTAAKKIQTPLQKYW